MGKSCWRARLAQTWQFYLFFPALSISVFTKSQVLNLRVGRSRDLLSQKAYCLQLKFFRNL